MRTIHHRGGGRSTGPQKLVGHGAGARCVPGVPAGCGCVIRRKRSARPALIPRQSSTVPDAKRAGGRFRVSSQSASPLSRALFRTTGPSLERSSREPRRTLSGGASNSAERWRRILTSPLEREPTSKGATRPGGLASPGSTDAAAPLRRRNATTEPGRALPRSGGTLRFRSPYGLERPRISSALPWPKRGACAGLARSLALPRLGGNGG